MRCTWTASATRQLTGRLRLGLLAVVVAAIASACTTVEVPTPAPPSGTHLPASPAPETPRPATALPALSVVAQLRIALPASPLGPLAIASDPLGVWVGVGGTPTGHLYRLAQDDGRIMARVDVGWAPGALADVGSVTWVANTIGDGSRPTSAAQNTLEAVDSGTFKILSRVDVLDPGLLAGSSASAWTLSANHDLVRVEVGQATRVASHDLSAAGLPTAMVLGDQLVVATRSATDDGSILLCLDSQTGATRAQLSIAESIGSMALGNGIVWATLQDTDANWSIDRLTADGFAPVVTLPQNIDAATFATNGRAAWIATNDGRLYMADLATAVVRELLVTASLGGSPIALAAAPDGLWMLMTSGVVKIRVGT